MTALKEGRREMQGRKNVSANRKGKRERQTELWIFGISGKDGEL